MAKNYAKPVELGTVMEGGCVGKVIASNDSEFAEGDRTGGNPFSLSLETQDRSGLGPHLYLNRRAGHARHDRIHAQFGKPQPMRVVVAAARERWVRSLGKSLKGARAVGIAGSEEKCQYVTMRLDSMRV